MATAEIDVRSKASGLLGLGPKKEFAGLVSLDQLT